MARIIASERGGKDTQYMDITPELTSNHISPILNPIKTKNPSFSLESTIFRSGGSKNEVPKMPD